MMPKSSWDEREARKRLTEKARLAASSLNRGRACEMGEGVRRSERGPDVGSSHRGAVLRNEEPQEESWRGRQAGWRPVEA